MFDDKLEKPQLKASAPKRPGCLVFIISFIILLAIGYEMADNYIIECSFILIIVVSFGISFLTWHISDKIYEKTPKGKIEIEQFRKAYEEYKKEEQEYNEKCEERILAVRQALIDRFNISESTLNNPVIVKYLKSQPQLQINGDNLDLMIWTNKDTLYLVHNDLVNCAGGIAIPIESIKSFLRQGDMYIETNVSGGGGGGSSLTGAVVGGVIAGGTGAVIGSRKKIEEIKTENKQIDNRETILEFEYYGKTYYMFLTSEAYDILLRMIPQKEFNYVSRDNIKKIENKSNDDTSFDNIRELAKLKEEGILTEEEFQAKKKQLLRI